MKRWASAFHRVLKLSHDAEVMMNRLHSRDVAGDGYHRLILARARTSAYGACWGPRNFPRLLQAERELKEAVARSEVFDAALWS